MSSGSAPTVFAKISLVRTSHSLSRFGYCRSELLLRGVPPAPALIAVPPTDLEQPVKTTSAAITTAAHTRQPCHPRVISPLISNSQSIGEPVLWLCRRAAETAFG